MSSIGVTASLVNAGGSIEASFWSAVGLVDVIVGSTYSVGTSESATAVESGIINSSVAAATSEASTSSDTSLYTYISATSSTPGVTFNYSNIGGSIEAALWASVGVNESGVGVGTIYSSSSVEAASASTSSSYSYIASTIGVAGISYSFQGTGGSIDAAPWTNINVISGPFTYPVTTTDSAAALDYYSTGSVFIISNSDSTTLAGAGSSLEFSAATDLATVGTQPVSIMVEYGFSMDAGVASYSSFSSGQESVNLSDSSMAGYTAMVALPEAATSVDSSVLVTGTLSDIQEVVTSLDTSTPNSGVPAFKIETGSASEVNSPTFSYQISSTESGSASDSSGKLPIASATGFDAALAFDFPSQITNALATTSEPVSATDSISPSPIWPTSRTDVGASSDVQTSSALFVPTRLESTSALDTTGSINTSSAGLSEPGNAAVLQDGVEVTSASLTGTGVALDYSAQSVGLNTTISEVSTSLDQQDSNHLLPVAAVMSATLVDSSSVITSFRASSTEVGHASSAQGSVGVLTLIYSDTGYARDLPGITYFDTVVEAAKALSFPAVTSLVGSHKLPALSPSGSGAKLFNLVIQKGTSYQLTMTFIDGKIGLPIDLSGFDGTLTVSNNHTQPAAITLSVANGGLVLGDTPGTVLAYFPPEATANVDWGRASYRLSVTGQNSGRTLMMKGLVTVVHTPFTVSSNPIASTMPGTGASVTIPSNQAYYNLNTGSDVGASSSYFAASNIDWSQ